MGISQALLSHYEKGIRECGLEFLVRAADYYNVSCDYLLGRSPEPAGKTISYEDIPDHDPAQKERLTAGGGMMASFNKKLIINAVNALFALVQKCESNTLIKEISSFLMLAVYKMFRVVYSANPKNDRNFFTIPEVFADGGANAAMAVSECNARDAVKEDKAVFITAAGLAEEYPNYASSLLNIIKNSEAQIQILRNSQK